jgi:hypothetical protein
MSFRGRPIKLWGAAVALMLLSPAVAADYLGKVTAVADGDTFTMESETGKVRVRICGIDAPERGQPGYGQAAGVLSNMIEGKDGSLSAGRRGDRVRRQIEAKKPRSHRRAVLSRQARPRGGNGEVGHGLRLAEILGRTLQDQRRDRRPEIARVAQTTGVTGHSHSISTRRRSLLFA